MEHKKHQIDPFRLFGFCTGDQDRRCGDCDGPYKGGRASVTCLPCALLHAQKHSERYNEQTQRLHAANEKIRELSLVIIKLEKEAAQCPNTQ